MPLEIKRLHHLTINAPSGEEEKVRYFYGKLLGLKEMPIPKKLTDIYEIIWFYLHDFILHIEFTKNFIKPVREESGPIMPGNHFSLEIVNLKKFRKEIESKGAVIKEAESLPDRERFYLVDPFENYIEIIEFFK